MLTLIFRFLFLFFTIFILLKTVFYGLYEIKTQNNKSGGIGVIVFSVLTTIFVNIVIFFKLII